MAIIDLNDKKQITGKKSIMSRCNLSYRLKRSGPYRIWKFPCTPMIDVPCQFCTKSIFISVVVLFYWINNIIFKTSFYFVYAHYLKRSSAIYMKYEYLSKQLLFRLSGVSKMHTKLFHFVRILNCKWNLLHYIFFYKPHNYI